MIISTPTIAGSGAISAVFAGPAGTMLAIASSFPLLTNPPGRAAYMGQHLRHRLALHRPGERAPFAVFDRLRLPINDVGFHPSDPVVAIAAGSYDGGYVFEGELWFWDWRSDRAWQPAKAVPEVERCRFSADGRQLDILVRPWDEGSAEAEGADDPFDRFYPARVPYAPAASAEPVAVVIDAAAAIARDALPVTAGGMRDAAAVERSLKDWLALGALDRRGAIWDLAFLDARRVAAVHDGCLMEVHDLAAGTVKSFRQDGRHGAAILRTVPPVVVARAGPGFAGEGVDLLRFTGEALVDTAHFAGHYAFSAASDGALVGRLDRHRAGKASGDVIMTSATAAPRLADLGHYDCFNHFLGIDGAPALFVIQGAPPDQHQHKRLCRVRADGTVEPLWPLLADDGSPASHAMECLGCHVEDELGPAVVLAGRHYDPDPRRGERGFLFRRPVGPAEAGRTGSPGRLRRAAVPADTWRHATAAAASAMAFMPAAGLVAVAFLDGGLSLFDAADGTVAVAGRVTIGGIPTVIYAMDAHDETLALGTFDGRIAVVTVAALKARAGAERIELGQDRI